MNFYEYLLIDHETTGTIKADYFLKEDIDYVFYKDNKVVHRIPIGWLIRLWRNGERVI